MRYAVQLKNTGYVVDYYNTPEEAKDMLTLGNLELVDTTKTSMLKVTYTELGGPNGYGHSEVSFVTYGGIKRCTINLINWIKETCRIFGPDARDIRDFFRHCTITINGKDVSDKLYAQIHNMDLNVLYL